MKRDAPDLPRGFTELVNLGAISHVPHAQHAVVAAAGEELAVGAERDAADPSLMRFHFADGLRCFGAGGPPDELVVATGADQGLPVGSDSEVKHPGLMGAERDGFVLRVLRCGFEVPAVDRAVLGTGKQVLAGGIEAARHEAARFGGQLEGDVRKLRVGRHHTSSSSMDSKAGSAIGTFCPAMLNRAVLFTPSAAR